MLEILAGGSPGKLVVRREHRTQRVEHVFPRLLARSALAECPGNLQHAGDDPAVRIGSVKGDRKVDGGRHRHTVAPAPTRGQTSVPLGRLIARQVVLRRSDALQMSCKRLIAEDLARGFVEHL